MKGQIKLCLKVAWLTASVVIFIIGSNDCDSAAQACFHSGETMFASMMFLSFPASILSAVVAFSLLGHESLDSLPVYLAVWLILTGGGYLQWFVLVPKLFEKEELTVLDLKPDKIALQAATIEKEELIVLELKSDKIAPETSTEENHPIAVRRPKRIGPIRAFDRYGRTPLERALGRRS